MFGIGLVEIALIGAVAVLVLKPQELARSARLVGRLYRQAIEFRRKAHNTLFGKGDSSDWFN